MDYRVFITEQLQVAAETARTYFGRVGGTVKTGDNNQVLTEADLAIGKQLVAAVEAAFPEHNVIDEEAGVIDKGSRYTWVIDPIDGTSNFAAGTSDYGIMIGLLEDGIPIAGGIVEPAHHKLFIGEKGKGVTCNGKHIKVTEEQKLQNVLVACGIDSHPDNQAQAEWECQILIDIIQAVRNLRTCGSDAVDPMYVAGGSYGAKIQFTSKIWDNVAPQIICEEAGALWTTLDGKPSDYTDPVHKAGQNFTFCVAPAVLHEQLQAIITPQS